MCSAVSNYLQSYGLQPIIGTELDCSPSGSSVHGASQTRILRGLPFAPPGGLPSPGMEPVSCIACIAGRFFTAELLGKHFPGGSDSKESACNGGDPGLIPKLGRTLKEGNDYPLQYSGLGNPMERGTWRATIPGVTKSRTRLSN